VKAKIELAIVPESRERICRCQHFQFLDLRFEKLVVALLSAAPPLANAV
jgi:hypothetical protein